MVETFLEMAERNVRESEVLVRRQQEIIESLEQGGQEYQLKEARALLHFLVAAHDAHRALLTQERAKIKGG